MLFLSRLRALIAVLFAGHVTMESPSRRPFVVDFATGRVLPPIAGAQDDDDSDDDDSADTQNDDASQDEPDGSSGNDDAQDEDDQINWKGHSRKHEREAKKARSRAEKAEAEKKRLEAELQELRDKDLSDQDKAIKEAAEKARQEALAEADKERRADQLEVATTRLAAKGIKAGEGDDAKTVKFADPEDALVHLERAINRGEIDAEEIFTETGRVNNDALSDALQELLESKPHLAEKDTPQPAPDVGGGKGDPPNKNLEDLSAEDHFKRRRRFKD